MNTQGHDGQLVGARIATVDAGEISQWIDWLTGSDGSGLEHRGVQFALAHCVSGVAWGFLDANNRWKLSHQADPNLSPVPTAQNILELRIFGTTSELLIWPSDEGLRGRWLVANGDSVHPHEPLRPRRETRFLRGTRSSSSSRDFVRYVDRGGAQHLAPVNFPVEFSVCHYFQQDGDTGAVRIVATRLCPEATS